MPSPDRRLAIPVAAALVALQFVWAGLILADAGAVLQVAISAAIIALVVALMMILHRRRRR